MRQLLLTLFLATTPATALAEAKPVTLDFKDRPLRQAVAELFKDRAPVRVEAPVPNVAVTVRTGEIPLETAARLVLHVASTSAPGLQLEREGDAFVYRMGMAAVPDPGLRPEKDERLQGKVSLDLPETTIRQALAKVFAGTGVSCVVLPVVPELPLRVVVKDVTARQALDAVMEQAYLQAPTLYLGQEGPAYVVGFRRAALIPQDARGLFADGRKGSLNIRDVGLRAALRIMLRNSGFEHTVDPKVPDVKLSFNIKEATLDEAIQAILAAAKGKEVDVKVSLKGKTYHFEPGGLQP